jgi:diketogulonate reductase-like aldo/keto reductase
MGEADGSRHGNMTRQGLQESLERMNLTYVDLYLMHFPVGQTSGPAKFDHVEVHPHPSDQLPL